MVRQDMLKTMCNKQRKRIKQCASNTVLQKWIQLVVFDVDGQVITRGAFPFELRVCDDTQMLNIEPDISKPLSARAHLRFVMLADDEKDIQLAIRCFS